MFCFMFCSTSLKIWKSASKFSPLEVSIIPWRMPRGSGKALKNFSSKVCQAGNGTRQTAEAEAHDKLVLRDWAFQEDQTSFWYLLVSSQYLLVSSQKPFANWRVWHFILMAHYWKGRAGTIATVLRNKRGSLVRVSTVQVNMIKRSAEVQATEDMEITVAMNVFCIIIIYIYIYTCILEWTQINVQFRTFCSMSISWDSERNFLQWALFAFEAIWIHLAKFAKLGAYLHLPGATPSKPCCCFIFLNSFCGWATSFWCLLRFLCSRIFY